MKSTLTLLATLLLAPQAALHAADAPKPASKPNILILLATFAEVCGAALPNEAGPSCISPWPNGRRRNCSTSSQSLISRGGGVFCVASRYALGVTPMAEPNARLKAL